MCEWGTTRNLSLWNSKLKEVRTVGIDSCIAEFVMMLNRNGMETVASCCGHGNQPISIILRDDTWIQFLTREQAEIINCQFPSICGTPDTGT